MNNKKLEEGDKCPECDPDCEGIMIYSPVKNCRCHINPPCSACVDNPLTCDECGYKIEPE